MMSRLLAVAVVGLAPLFPSAAEGQRSDLGRISFENSGAVEAQGAFIDGVLLLHSFEYEDAAEAFRRAQRIDPGFALAYWGEAMTYNHPIWMQQDREAALEALGRLGATPSDRRAKAGTEREARYLDAIEVLYGDGDKRDRDDRHADAMRRLHEDHPDDAEAAVFYALALLGTAHEGRDFPTYMVAASVADPVFEANPEHPGAAHMLIHSFDDPVHAPLGLPAAHAYSTIAPGAAHAQHMTSHIFVARGMWDAVVGANEVARDVQNARQGELGRRKSVCGHYTSWLEYGYLQQGRFDDAKAVLSACAARMDEGPAGQEPGYYGSMLLMYAVDTEDWDTIETLRRDVAGPVAGAIAWVDGYRAVLADDEAAARAALARMSPRGGFPKASALELEGMIELRWGAGVDSGLALLTEAAELEASLPYEFGPPRVSLPTYEALGDGLLRAGRAAEAVDAYRTQLQRTPGRARTLVGLAAAATEAGDAAMSREALDQLEGEWRTGTSSYR
jgi:tetratricopeptide (TPR) repeat protein